MYPHRTDQILHHTTSHFILPDSEHTYNLCRIHIIIYTEFILPFTSHTLTSIAYNPFKGTQIQIISLISHSPPLPFWHKHHLGSHIILLFHIIPYILSFFSIGYHFITLNPFYIAQFTYFGVFSCNIYIYIIMFT